MSYANDDVEINNFIKDVESVMKRYGCMPPQLAQQSPSPDIYPQPPAFGRLPAANVDAKKNHAEVLHYPLVQHVAIPIKNATIVRIAKKNPPNAAPPLVVANPPAANVVVAAVKPDAVPPPVAVPPPDAVPLAAKPAVNAAVNPPVGNAAAAKQVVVAPGVAAPVVVAVGGSNHYINKYTYKLNKTSRSDPKYKIYLKKLQYYNKNAMYK